jgi:hypothetical protein
MHAVTFYSYRGGTGRTTALVNVAADLARRGRKVLLIDFNLDAPGLSSFDLLRPDTVCPGLVEFVDEYLRLNHAPAVEDYVYQAKPFVDGSEGVRVMPAGRCDEDYWAARARIDWQDLYAFHDGFLLFEALKTQWQRAFAPDYVLIDAPSGINDTTAICTRQLPDAVVLIHAFAQGDGNSLTGIHRVLKDVFAESIAQGPRRIDIHLVASKAPDLDGDEDYLSSFLEPAGLDIIFDDSVTEIPHAPALLLGNQVIIDKNQRSRLTRAYCHLTNAIIVGNCVQDADGAHMFLRDLQSNPNQLIETVDDPFSHSQMRWFRYHPQRFDQLLDHFAGKTAIDVAIRAQAASCLFLAGEAPRAREILDEIIHYGDDERPGFGTAHSDILWQLASYSCSLRHPHAADDLLRVLDSRDPQLLVKAHEKLLARLSESKFWQPLLSELDTASLNTVDKLADDLPGLDRYVVSAFRQLKQLAPHRIDEAMRKPCIQCLSPADRDILLAESPNTVIADNPRRLIQLCQWSQVIALLEPRRAPSTSLCPDDESTFHLAMAYWGNDNEAQATTLCKSLATSFRHGSKQLMAVLKSQKPTASKLEVAQLLSLLFWKAEDPKAAKDLLASLMAAIDLFEGGALFSFWRYRKVSRRQFDLDCTQLRKMFAGAHIRPAFLGKVPSNP